MEKGDEFEAPEGYGDYFRQKNQKLQQQYKRDAQINLQRRGSTFPTKAIFRGVVAYVNGHTRPNAHELRALIVENGGQYTQYPSRRVTHTIAVTLPTAKIVNLQPNDIVVHPSWVVDCVKEGVKLNEDDYRLYRGKGGGDDRQKSMDGYFRRNSKDRSAQNDASDGNGVKIARSDAKRSNGADARRDESVRRRERRDVSTSTSTTTKPAVSVPQSTSSSTATVAAPSAVETASKTSSKRSRPLAAEDPVAFIAEYYKQSRLHRLSTWKTEFRMRVEDMILKRVQRPRDAVGSGDEAGASGGAGSGNGDVSAATGANQLQFHDVRSGSGDGRRDAGGSDMRGGEHVYFYIDLDCFFANVAARTYAGLRGKPIAVTHAASASDAPHFRTADSLDLRGTRGADISSCSYEARKYGVYNGMSVASAAKLCPKLILVPYQFEEYERTSMLLYETLLGYTRAIDVRSVDEAILDMSAPCGGLGASAALRLAEEMRAEIARACGCTASIGIGTSMLLAKLAMRDAKPNGAAALWSDQAEAYLASLPVAELPTVGWKHARRLKALGIETCGELRAFNLADLQAEFGKQVGEQMQLFAKGIDNRAFSTFHERKSVGAEVNFGIRLNTNDETCRFMEALGAEVQRRMERAGVVGDRLAIHIMLRKSDAPAEPSKFMGHGRVDKYSRQVRMARATNDGAELAREALALMRKLSDARPERLRGIGLHVSGLTRVDAATMKRMRERAPATIDRFLSNMGDTKHANDSTGTRARTITIDSSGAVSDSRPRRESLVRRESMPPPPLPSRIQANVDRRKSTARTVLSAPPPDSPNASDSDEEAGLGVDAALAAVSAPKRSSASERRRRRSSGAFVEELPPASAIDPQIWLALDRQTRRQHRLAYRAKDPDAQLPAHIAATPSVTATQSRPDDDDIDVGEYRCVEQRRNDANKSKRSRGGGVKKTTTVATSGKKRSVSARASERKHGDESLRKRSDREAAVVVDLIDDDVEGERRVSNGTVALSKRRRFDVEIVQLDDDEDEEIDENGSIDKEDDAQDDDESDDAESMQWDESVLMALPEDVRKDLIRERELRKRARREIREHNRQAKLKRREEVALRQQWIDESRAGRANAALRDAETNNGDACADGAARNGSVGATNTDMAALQWPPLRLAESARLSDRDMSAHRAHCDRLAQSMPFRRVLPRANADTARAPIRRVRTFSVEPRWEVLSSVCDAEILGSVAECVRQCEEVAADESFGVSERRQDEVLLRTVMEHAFDALMSGGTDASDESWEEDEARIRLLPYVRHIFYAVALAAVDSCETQWCARLLTRLRALTHRAIEFGCSNVHWDCDYQAKADRYARATPYRVVVPPQAATDACDGDDVAGRSAVAHHRCMYCLWTIPCQNALEAQVQTYCQKKYGFKLNVGD